MKRVLFACAIMVWGMFAAAEESERLPTAEEAIRQAVRDYVTAYNQRDAKALAALWSAEAVYTNRATGEQVAGREAIEAEFTEIFAEAKEARLQASTESIQFISPSVALERGTAAVIRPDTPPEKAAYTAVYVKQDDKWLLDRVTEGDVLTSDAQDEPLRKLEWLIGSWLDEDDKNRIETTYAWTKNESFITCFFTVAVEERVEMSGLQIIGWDPAAKKIRSWVFDSDGGFGEGTWSEKDRRFSIQLKGMLSDGRKSSSVIIITQVDDETCTWQSINRELDGEILPNVDEVVVVRQQPAE